MKHSKLGALEVGRIGLGAMGMSAYYTMGEASETESIKTIHRAIDLGVTLIDTAEVYGPYTNEELVGKALKGKREQVVLATKFGVISHRNGGINALDSNPENIRTAVEGSLRRLQTDYIDLYYQHRVDPAVPIEETVGAMADLITEGKIKHIGLSEAGPETLRRAAAVAPISALQSEYSLWERDIEDDILPTCRELGIGFVPYSPLGRGFLTGSFRSLDELPENDWRRQDPRFQGDNFATNLAIVDVVGEIAAKHNASHAQIALAWILAQGNDIVPIPGFKRRVTMEDSAKASDVSLDAHDLATLDLAAPRGGTSGPRYGERGMKMVRL